MARCGAVVERESSRAAVASDNHGPQSHVTILESSFAEIYGDDLVGIASVRANDSLTITAFFSPA